METQKHEDAETRESAGGSLSLRHPVTSSPPHPSPRWREDFPINWEDDHYVTRREFTFFLTIISGAWFFGTALVGLRTLWQRWWAVPPSPLRVAAIADLPVGEAKGFHYPTSEDPCVLVRLAADRFVAYSQKCTHLSCPVIYKAADRHLHCPCHEGFFSVEDGRALAGPPKRALPQIALTLRGAEVWATGVEV
jgi:nitrite reductase/ring-hydroxylating ferredoxin subunit